MVYDPSRGSVLESLCEKILLWNSRTDAVPSDRVVRTIRRRKEYDPVTSDEGVSEQLCESRLRSRGTEKEEDIERRLKHAREDLAEVEQNPDLFDHVIINDNFEQAYKEFIAVIEEDLMSAN
ncbi:unnamed protein product [Nippostrongylus brasiliensis]|uniref:Guanylate kinase (inferred by orthology to a human protein) n=1 Tax=Nippostrongylus brasiliensis TaxID=27835 RepID=A0A0N4YEM5_NIPBR|nr:unnamed protein product [Nippostrongylus brasiliensis]